MRRSLSGLVLGLALMTASFSWAGFVMGQTVLNPDRSEAFASQVVANQRLRSAITGRIADGLAEQLPFDLPIPRSVLEGAAADSLDEPGIQSELQRALVQVHQNALNGVEEDVSLDASVLGISARNQLIGDRPELQERVPEAPAINVVVPTAGLAILGTVRSAVATFTLLSALGSAVAAILALIMARDRPQILRRVARWAFGTAVFWLAMGFGVPIVASVLAPSSAGVIAGAIEVFFGAMINPAIAMVVFGGAFLVLSAIWPTLARRRPARAIHSRPVESPEIEMMSAPKRRRLRKAKVKDRSLTREQANAGVPRQRSATPTAFKPTVDAPADPTRLLPVDLPPRATADQVAAAKSDSPPEWKPGVGYLDR